MEVRTTVLTIDENGVIKGMIISIVGGFSVWLIKAKYLSEFDKWIINDSTGADMRTFNETDLATCLNFEQIWFANKGALLSYVNNQYVLSVKVEI